jgi:hypothetical protein
MAHPGKGSRRANSAVDEHGLTCEVGDRRRENG